MTNTTNANPCPKRQTVILKADDLLYDPEAGLSAAWVRFLSFLERHQIKAGLGIVGHSLEEAGEAWLAGVRRLHESCGHELWNHGYDHVLNGVDEAGAAYCEFRDTSCEQQLEHLLRTQRLAWERLGITLHTFGAPGNAIDERTVQALHAVPELKVWLFGLPSDKFVLERRVHAEVPVIRPNCEAFLQQYDAGLKYIVLQLHPGHWSEADFRQFTLIMDILLKKQVDFMTPYTYFLQTSQQASAGF